MKQGSEFKGKNLRLETGLFAKQADGSVIAKYGDTVVLATAVAKKEAREELDAAKKEAKKKKHDTYRTKIWSSPKGKRGMTPHVTR